MILVITGTEPYPFDRLMQWVNALTTCGFLGDGEEEIIVQSGNSRVLPAGARSYPTLPDSQLSFLMHRARLVIAPCDQHALQLLKQVSTPYILVPRSPAMGEAFDHTQIKLAIALARADIPIAWAPGDVVRFLVAPRRGNMATINLSGVACR
jgi:UDP-N-acetylglucosamine transferase subunit ALG13